MKFLIDNALSPIISEILTENGFDSIHVRDINLQNADDETIFFRAKDENRIIVSADTDFGTLLSLWEFSKPSFILFRKVQSHKPKDIASILLTNLSQFESELETGYIVVFEQNRIRLRKLPIMQSKLNKSN